MKCQTSEEWKTIVSTLQNLTEEASFDVDSSGVKFRAMDPSHVALIDLAWEGGGFEKFEFHSKEEGVKDRFAVRVEDFAKIIKRADKNDSITISRNDSSSPSSSEALLIKLGENRNFEFHLLDRESVSSAPLPKLSLVSKFSINRAEFEGVLDDISALSNHVRISAEPGGTLTFSGKGDAGNAKVNFSRGELVKFESPQESDAVYSLEYIQKVLKPASSSSEVVEFSFGSKMPLAASVNVGDPSKSKLKLTFFLAPRTSE
jgi:proliferating cell nuclear antigen